MLLNEELSRVRRPQQSRVGTEQDPPVHVLEFLLHELTIEGIGSDLDFLPPSGEDSETVVDVHNRVCVAVQLTLSIQQ